MVDDQNVVTPVEEHEAEPISPLDDAQAVVEEPVEAGEEEASAPAEGTAHLIVKRNGIETDVEFTFGSPCIIGRFDPTVGPIDVDLAALPEGAYVSRKHAKLSLEDGVWKLTDLGSSNGSYVLRGGDFERVEEAEVNDGDEIALGNARFVFHV